jgi:hypothetical protein
MQDGKEDAGSNKGNDNTDDQATGAPDPQETGYPAADEGSEQADDNISDQSIASPTHHPTGEKASYQSYKQPPEHT